MTHVRFDRHKAAAQGPCVQLTLLRNHCTTAVGDWRPAELHTSERTGGGLHSHTRWDGFVIIKNTLRSIPKQAATECSSSVICILTDMSHSVLTRADPGQILVT